MTQFSVEKIYETNLFIRTFCIFIRIFLGEKFARKSFISIFSASPTCGELMAVQRNCDYSKSPDDTIFLRFVVHSKHVYRSVSISMLVLKTRLGESFKLFIIEFCWVHSLHWILMGFPFIPSEFGIKLLFVGVKSVPRFLQNVFCIVFILKCQMWPCSFGLFSKLN